MDKKKLDGTVDGSSVEQADLSIQCYCTYCENGALYLVLWQADWLAGWLAGRQTDESR